MLKLNKKTKYKDLEMENIWRLKSTCILKVVGALGMIKKETDKYN